MKDDEFVCDCCSQVFDIDDCANKDDSWRDFSYCEDCWEDLEPFRKVYND